MGAYNSKLLLDFPPNQNESFEYNLHSWEHTKPKNVQYYTGERFFKIPRHNIIIQHYHNIIIQHFYKMMTMMNKHTKNIM